MAKISIQNGRLASTQQHRPTVDPWMWTILKEMMSYGTDETDIWVAFKIRGKSPVDKDNVAPHPEFRQLQFIAFVAWFYSSFYHTIGKAKENQNQRFLGSENDCQGVHQA